MHESSQIALKEIRAKAGRNRKIVFVSGNFNIVHPGHVRLLKFAADCGDMLVVGVNAVTAPGQLIPAELRVESIRSVSFVGYAFLLHEPPEVFIEALRPALVVKGKEFEERFNPEQAAVARYGGHLLFSSGESTFSSLELMRREFVEVNLATIVKAPEFPARHGFSLADLHELIGWFTRLSITVIGDLIVDEYIACDPLGMSQEDPSIVITPVLSERFIGGAGIVAAHARGMGAKAQLISVTGCDAVADFAVEKLQSYEVTPVVFRDDSRPTTLKQRYRAGDKTLLRVSHLRQHGISQDLQEQILRATRDAVVGSDLIVFSDFNYGVLPQSLVDEICELGREHGVMMVADSQSSSQIGDISRFRGMKLIKPTEREARLALRDFDSGLVVLADRLREKAQAESIILTLGAEGLLMQGSTGNGDESMTDKLPSFNTTPKDSAGAGDSLLTCASLALAAGASIWPSAYLGAIAAACQMSRVGNLPLLAHELRTEIASP